MKSLLRRGWIWWGSGSAVGLALALTFVFGDWIREQIIKPLFYDWLYLQLYFYSLPGLLLWVVFLALATLALAITVVDLFKQKSPAERFAPSREKVPLRDLSEKVELACAGSLFRWSLNRELSDLAIALIMLRERVDALEARRRFNSGMWTPNEEIRNLFAIELKPNFRSRLRELFTARVSDVAFAQHRERLEEIVAYLEEYSGAGGISATD